MEIDQPVQCGIDVARLGHHSLGSRQQPGADADQQLDQQRFLVWEMPVDRRAADTRGGPDVLQSHREVTAFGDQPLGGCKQLDAPVRLESAAAGLGVGGGGHFG